MSSRWYRFFKILCYLYNSESLVIYLVICLQSMHWAMRSKKEPMLEASKAEIPVASPAEDHHAKQEAQRISAHDAVPSSSKQISKCSLSNGKYGGPISFNVQKRKQKLNQSGHQGIEILFFFNRAFSILMYMYVCMFAELVPLPFTQIRASTIG